jgi:hypothetical protein
MRSEYPSQETRDCTWRDALERDVSRERTDGGLEGRRYDE